MIFFLEADCHVTTVRSCRQLRGTRVAPPAHQRRTITNLIRSLNLGIEPVGFGLNYYASDTRLQYFNTCEVN